MCSRSSVRHHLASTLSIAHRKRNALAGRRPRKSQRKHVVASSVRACSSWSATESKPWPNSAAEHTATHTHRLPPFGRFSCKQPQAPPICLSVGGACSLQAKCPHREMPDTLGELASWPHGFPLPRPLNPRTHSIGGGVIAYTIDPSCAPVLVSESVGGDDQ
jgi:hypothetical protein